MAAKVKESSRKITLDLKEGSQSIAPILLTASDEAIYETGEAIGTLQSERVEAIVVVDTEEIIAG